jgi:hypothetical protein
MSASHQALAVALKLTTAELRISALQNVLKGTNWRDQPRVPSGNPYGGQWMRMGVYAEGRVRIAVKKPRVRCYGFACHNGGWYQHSGMHYIDNKVMCPHCVVKYLGIQEMTAEERLRTIKNFERRRED